MFVVISVVKWIQLKKY